MTLVSETIRASRQQATAPKTPELVTTSPTHAIGLDDGLYKKIFTGNTMSKKKKSNKEVKKPKAPV